MSHPKFVSLYTGNSGEFLGRHLTDWQAQPGWTRMNIWNYESTGLYALDDNGRPWAYVVDNTVYWASGGTDGDPEKLRKWIPL